LSADTSSTIAGADEQPPASSAQTNQVDRRAVITPLLHRTRNYGARYARMRARCASTASGGGVAALGQPLLKWTKMEDCMRSLRWGLFLAAAFVYGNGCSCSNSAGTNGDQGVGDDGGGGGPDLAINPDAIAGGALMVTPPDVTLDITQGGAAPSQVYVAKTNTGTDVSSMATWTVDDTSLGGFSGATFTANTQHGGTTYVHATWQGLTGYATLHVKLHASITNDTCPGCPPFPPAGTPACPAGSAQTPTVIYPPNGTLVPPNMNVLETQFDQGSGNTLYEIDYENAATDVTVLTKCNPITDSKGGATNGCSYDLSQVVWDFLSQSNRGGDPLNIIVRATNAAGSCAATSFGQTAISFAQEDLNGGIYYWQSVTVSGLNGATGGIFRYDFGKRGQAPTPFLAPTASGGTMQHCIGCHFLSRDGVK